MPRTQIFSPKFYLNNYKLYEQELPILHPLLKACLWF